MRMCKLNYLQSLIQINIFVLHIYGLKRNQRIKLNLVVVDAYDENYNKMWFKEGRFPINIHGESLGYLLNGTGIKIKVNTLDRLWMLKANIK